jgi:hypothetical protein
MGHHPNGPALTGDPRQRGRGRCHRSEAFQMLVWCGHVATDPARERPVLADERQERIADPIVARGRARVGAFAEGAAGWPAGPGACAQGAAR